MNSYPIFKTTTRITLDIGHTLTYGCPVRSLDIRELEPTVKRAAAKMAQKYFLRLSRRRVVCPEDLENVGWVRVFSQIRHITTLRPCACVKMKGCTHRRGYVYRLVCNAIHNEMRDISANGDDAVRLTPQGTTDTGAKDSSYDGGPTVFGTDESAPAAVVPSCEYWTPPVVWDEWQRMSTRGRTKLIVAAGFSAVEMVNDYGGTSKFLVAAQWREIPWDMQEAITAVWLETARGVLRTNKHANGTKPRKSLGFASQALPHPDELAQITPPRLRAIALLVYGGGFYSGHKVYSGEIAEVLSKRIGLSSRTVQRDHAELLKLWSRYTRASVDEKRDESRFPRYPLPDAVAREFASLPENAAMPDSSNPVLTSAIMSSGRLRSLRHRMKKYHTDFSNATFTYPVAVQAEDTQTIDYFYRAPTPNDSHAWIPIVCRDGNKQPLVWLHDWSEHKDLFGDRPGKRSYGSANMAFHARSVVSDNLTQTRQLSPLYLTTQRGTSVAVYQRNVTDEKYSYCVCELCLHLRARDRKYFADVLLNPDPNDLPLSLSPLTVGMMHGYSRPVGNGLRYKETHYLGRRGGHGVWGVVEDGLAYCYWERISVLSPVVFVSSMTAADWIDSRTVAEIIADYTSPERRRYQKEFAAGNENARVHTAWVLADKELTREADARIRAAIIAAEQRRQEESAA